MNPSPIHDIESLCAAYAERATAPHLEILRAMRDIHVCLYDRGLRAAAGGERLGSEYWAEVEWRSDGARVSAMIAGREGLAAQGDAVILVAEVDDHTNGPALAAEGAACLANLRARLAVLTARAEAAFAAADATRSALLASIDGVSCQ